MMVVYDSRTGNVARFVAKLGVNGLRLEEHTVVDKPFVLVTYTTGFGEVPEKVRRFLVRNHACLKGVAASGNRNWGRMFAASADAIAAAYQVPVLVKFELSGTSRDVEQFWNGVRQIESFGGKTFKDGKKS